MERILWEEQLELKNLKKEMHLLKIDQKEMFLKKFTKVQEMIYLKFL